MHYPVWVHQIELQLKYIAIFNVGSCIHIDECNDNCIIYSMQVNNSGHKFKCYMFDEHLKWSTNIEMVKMAVYNWLSIIRP